MRLNGNADPAARIAALEAENSRLRRRLYRLEEGRQYHYSERLQRAMESAEAIALVHCSDYVFPTREVMEGVGLPQRQWTNGMALLRLAGVVCKGRFVDHDMSIVRGKVYETGERLASMPWAFYTALPKSARPDKYK